MNESMPRSGETAGGAKAQIREKAAGLAQGAKEQARAQYDEKKGAAVGELGTLASSLRKVVDDLGTSNPNNMSGKVVSTIADRLESVSQSLQGKDLDHVVRDVETFARRNPAAFLGGAVALGFLASRFLKSSGTGSGSFGGSEDRFYRSETYSSSYSSGIGSTTPTGGGALDTPNDFGIGVGVGSDTGRKGQL
jgi:hypothetical protein